MKECRDIITYFIKSQVPTPLVCGTLEFFADLAYGVAKRIEMNSGVLKVCPLCGSRTDFNHRVTNIIGHECEVTASIRCMKEGCGIELSEVVTIGKGLIPAPSRATTAELEKLEGVKVCEISLLKKWNTRDPKYAYTTNAIVAK